MWKTMNLDICNIHPQIRIYVYALADPRRSAGSGWIWIRTLRCSSSGAQRGVRISRPLDGWIQPLEGRSSPKDLASCLNMPIWDGIMAQDPAQDLEPARVTHRGAPRGAGTNPRGGADPKYLFKKPKQILKKDKPPFYKWFTDGVTNTCYCLLYTSPSPRDLSTSRMPSSA